jgi:hypothetical protein
MQVDLINLIHYSCDALLFSHKQFAWSKDWGTNMGNHHGWDSNQKGSRHGANLGRPPVDAYPAGTADSASGATCAGLRHDHRFGTIRFQGTERACASKSSSSWSPVRTKGKNLSFLISMKFFHAISRVNKGKSKPGKSRRFLLRNKWLVAFSAYK